MSSFEFKCIHVNNSHTITRQVMNRHDNLIASLGRQSVNLKSILTFQEDKDIFHIMKALEKINEMILSREEYEALIERVEDLKDTINTYEIKKENDFIPWEEAKKTCKLY